MMQSDALFAQKVQATFILAMLVFYTKVEATHKR